jgi:regulatory protein
MDKEKPAATKKKRRVSRDYLNNACGYYLQRYSSSEANFRSVLWRKVQRCEQGDATDEEIDRWIDEICDKFRRIGALDDALYARNKVRALRRAGKSKVWIANTLRAKGVDPSLIAGAMAEHEALTDEDDEWRAVLTFAKRKGFGPYRRHQRQPRQQGDQEDPQAEAKLRNRQLAAFARAGFKFEVARLILDANDVSDLENG